MYSKFDLGNNKTLKEELDKLNIDIVKILKR
jgi:hypothetical protein